MYMCHSAHVEVTGQVVGVSFLITPSGFQKLNSGLVKGAFTLEFLLVLDNFSLTLKHTQPIFLVVCFFLKIYFYVYEHFACIHMCTICVQCLWRPDKSIRIPETGVKAGSEASCRCWELKLGIYKSSECSKPLSHLSGTTTAPAMTLVSFIESPHTYPNVSITQKAL